MNLSKFYKNKKILITGITGIKGCWLAIWLSLLGAKVYGISSKKKKRSLFYKLNLQKKFLIKHIDIRETKKISDYINKVKPQIVFHFASQTIIFNSYKFPQKTFDINLNGSLNILEAVRKSKFIKSLIITTSDKCYANSAKLKAFKENDCLGAEDPYTASKVSVEMALKAYQKSFFKQQNIASSSVRSGNVIGGGDFSEKRLMPECIKFLMSKRKIIILRNPSFNRPWQFILEPLKGYLILAKKQFERPKKYSGSWNFGTKPNTLANVKSIANIIIKYWGSGKIYIRRGNFSEQKNLQLDITKAKKLLKWHPTYDLKKSIKITVEWYKKVLIYRKDPKLITENQIKSYMNESKIS